MKTIPSRLLLSMAILISCNAIGQDTWHLYNTSNGALLSNRISSMAFDLEHNLWVAYSGAGGTGLGVARFDGASWHNYDMTNSGLANTDVRAIAVDRTGNVWFACYNAGVVKYNGSTWTTYNTSNSGIVGNGISTIAVDDHNNIWLGAYFSGISKFDGTTWTNYNAANAPFPSSNCINDLAIDHDNNVWVGLGCAGGLARLNTTSDQWTSYTTSNSAIPHHTVTAIIQDHAGRIWTGFTSNVISSFDGSTWTNYYPFAQNATHVTYDGFALDAAGSVVCGSAGEGLYRFNATGWNKTVIPGSGSGLSIFSQSVAVDASGNIWWGEFDRGIWKGQQAVPMPPWQLITGGPENHVIVIPDQLTADLAGEALEAGDYIGIFFRDENNVPQLSGSLRWTGASSTITAWGTSATSKNGFNAGEEFIVKVWKARSGKVLDVTATYDTQAPFDPSGKYASNGLSKITSLKISQVCQSLTLYKGWNLVSTYVKAADQKMSAIFQQVNNVVVKDASGKILYAPEYAITQGLWNISEGYMVYSAAHQVFSVCGQRIPSETTISLVKNAYPVFLPYYGDVQVPAATALQGLGSNYTFAQSLEYQHIDGMPQARNYIPAHIIDPPVDQIGNMKPGLAYKVILQNNVPAFKYPSAVAGRLRAEDFVAPLLAKHFAPVEMTFASNAVLVLPNALLEKTLSAGDEVAVLNQKGEVMGAAVYQGGTLAITVNDAGEPGKETLYHVSYWSAKTDEAYGVALTYAMGNGNFVANTLSVASHMHILENESGADPAISVFPNPAQHSITFGVHATQECLARITLLNVFGQEAGELFNGKMRAGYNGETFDITRFPAGQYFYRMMLGDKVVYDKLLIMK